MRPTSMGLRSAVGQKRTESIFPLSYVGAGRKIPAARPFMLNGILVDLIRADVVP